MFNFTIVTDHVNYLMKNDYFLISLAMATILGGGSAFIHIWEKLHPLKNQDKSAIREKAKVLDEGVMEYIKIHANNIKKHIDEKDYISFGGSAINATLKFNKNEFVDILNDSRIFELKDNKISLIYKKDRILVNHINKIIQNLEIYQTVASKLSDLIENLDESSIPPKFEENFRNLLINEFGGDDFGKERFTEFLFISYVVSISGSKNSYSSGKIFMIEIIKKRYDDLQYIARSDLKSKDTYSIIEGCLNNILSCQNNLIEEIEYLHEEWQNKLIIS